MFSVVTGCAALQEPQPMDALLQSAPSLTSTSGVSVSRKRSRSFTRASHSENLEIGQAVYAQMEEESAIAIDAPSRAERILPPPTVIAAATVIPTPAASAPLRTADLPQGNPESIATPATPATPAPSAAAASGNGRARPSRNDAAFSSLEYESRFHDVIFNSDAYSMGAQRKITPYAVLHSSVDSRSSAGGVVPIVYNDNAEILNGGARYRLGNSPGTFLFMEGGEGFSLIGKGNHPDFRYGWDSWSEHGSATRAHTSYGFSSAFYSRYGGDVIGYGTILHDFPFRRGIRGVVGINGALDDHREYYNNIGEIEGGVQAGTSHLQLRILGAAGTYLSRGVGIPNTRSYTSFRPTIFWSQQLK